MPREPGIVAGVHLKAAGEIGRETRGGSAPLLLGIAFDELLIYNTRHLRQGCLFEVARGALKSRLPVGTDGSPYIGLRHWPLLVGTVHKGQRPRFETVE